MHQSRYENYVPWGFSSGDCLYHSKEFIVLLSHCAQGRIQNLTGYSVLNEPREILSGKDPGKTNLEPLGNSVP